VLLAWYAWYQIAVAELTDPVATPARPIDERAPRNNYRATWRHWGRSLGKYGCPAAPDSHYVPSPHHRGRKSTDQPRNNEVRVHSIAVG
jgi:hypothetical protein